MGRACFLDNLDAALQDSVQSKITDLAHSEVRTSHFEKWEVAIRDTRLMPSLPPADRLI